MSFRDRQNRRHILLEYHSKISLNTYNYNTNTKRIFKKLFKLQRYMR